MLFRHFRFCYYRMPSCPISNMDSRIFSSFHFWSKLGLWPVFSRRHGIASGDQRSCCKYYNKRTAPHSSPSRCLHKYIVQRNDLSTSCYHCRQLWCCAFLSIELSKQTQSYSLNAHAHFYVKHIIE